MSKIICDVCGTAFPETATQCPICGCARGTADQAVIADNSPEDTSYVYTKGGRFSKRNVRRRTQKGTQEPRTTAVRKSEEGEEQTNMGLVVLVIILLLAIIAIVIYIGIRFFAPFDNADKNPIDTVGSNGISQTQQATELKIPCTALEISNKTIEFRLSGDAWLLETVATPADTTDKVTYTSANDKVAIVSETGCVTAVGGGETVITVTCGEIKQECKIICSFAGAEIPTEGSTETPTEGTTSGPVDTSFVFEFDTRFKDEASGKYDTTINAPGKTWRSYKKSMTVSPADITWTSDDPTIATIENGVVTAVKPGITEVHAKYGDKTYTCIIRCSWKETAGTDDNTQATEGNENTASGFEFNTIYKDGEKWDITLKPGNKWTAYKKSSGIKPEDVTWKVDDTGVCTVDNGVVTIVATTKDTTLLHAEYEGKTYTCIVRVDVS